MAGFGLELPTIQNWSCHNCSGCCRQHGIFITEAERERIEKQDWKAADGIPAEQPLFVRMGGGLKTRWWRLAHQPDGSCVFLNAQGLCRIHAKFGEEAKPLACRIYPYAFHPAGKKVAVSLRFSCPSVVKNLGRPVAAQAKDLRQIARLVVPENVTDASPPDIAPGSRVDWPDLLKFVRALDDTFADPGAPVLVKLLRALFWIGLVEQARFEQVRGERLGEFLQLIGEAARSEVAADVPAPVAAAQEPGRVGRTQFRLLAGQYARKDTYASADGTLRGRWRLLQSALRLTRGEGAVPAVQDCFREVPFATLEQPFGGVPSAADEIFTRYFRVKIQGMHFCGRAYYNVPFVEGFYSLALVYPAVLWIARWLAASAARTSLTAGDVVQALTIADHHHGYSPAFGTWGFRRRVKTLAQMGDVARLCVWYSR
jgi:lysine-N-methylase